jgi:hypothetical protein
MGFILAFASSFHNKQQLQIDIDSIHNKFTTTI